MPKAVYLLGPLLTQGVPHSKHWLLVSAAGNLLTATWTQSTQTNYRTKQLALGRLLGTRRDFLSSALPL